MDGVSKYETRSVNWSHPMNNSTHLPPKSPHGVFSMFSSTSLFESSGASSVAAPGGHHRRSPSAGYVPVQQQQQQASWLSDRLQSPDIVLKKCSHRRSSSDSVAFVDTSYQYMNYLENVTEEEEHEWMLHSNSSSNHVAVESPGWRHRRGVSADLGSADQRLQYKKFPATHRSYPAEKSATRGDQSFSRDHFPRSRDAEFFQRLQQQQQQSQPSRHENVAAYNNNNNHNRAGSSSSSPASASPTFANPGPSQQEESRSGAKAKKHVAVTMPDIATSPVAPPRGVRSTLSWSHNNNNNNNNNNNSNSGASAVSASATFESRSTASESNSHSDDSNDDARVKSHERWRGGSDSELRGNEEGAEGCSDHVDPKKAKRILANRQSAQRSRVRKLQYIAELEMNVNLLETEVAALSPKVGFYDHERALLSKENALLKQNLAALAKSQRLKEAYNETLKTELQRLRQIHTQHNQPRQPSLSPDSLRYGSEFGVDTLDLQLRRFSKLELGGGGPPPHSSSMPMSPPYARPSLSGRPSLYPASKVISPTRSPNGNNRPSPQRVPPSCMAPGGGGGGGGGKLLGGGMLGNGASFMVRNS